jgi:hypothetical protein
MFLFVVSLSQIFAEQRREDPELFVSAALSGYTFSSDNYFRSRKDAKNAKKKMWIRVE